MFISAVPGREAFFSDSERQHLSAKRSDEEQSIGGDNSIEVDFDDDGSLAFFHEIAQVGESMAGGELLVKLDWKSGCRAGVAVQVVTRAWSALSKAMAVGSFEAAYSPYVLYSGRRPMLQVLKSRSAGLSLLSQRESFDGMHGAVSSREKTDGAVWGRTETVDSAMRLLTLKFFKHLHNFLGMKTLFSLQDEKLLELSAVEQFNWTGAKLLLVFASLEDEITRPLQIERLCGPPSEVVERDDEGNVVGCKAACEATLCLKKGPSLVYGGKGPGVQVGKELVSKKRGGSHR